MDSNLLPPERIAKFIARHHVLTLATNGPGGLWCSNIFYAYIKSENAFVFTSGEATRHGSDMAADPHVAASVVLETRVVGKIQGLQITGEVKKVLPEQKQYRAAYLRRFPYAAVAELDLWVLFPLAMKLTDNTLGFGKKIAWSQTAHGTGAQVSENG